MTTPETTPTVIKNANSTIGWVNDDVIHLKWRQDVELEIPDIDEVEAAFQELTKGKKVKVLSEFGNYVNISAEARDYAAARSPECIALAYVITSLAQRIVIRFYIRLRRRQNPTKVFTSREEALNWLKTM
jgi:hypothetical protein